MQLKWEDDVILVLAELADEALGLAQLWSRSRRKRQATEATRKAESVS